MQHAPRATTLESGVEWRTVALAVVIHGSWVTLVLTHRHVPFWLTMGALAVVVAWHGSLQHEVVHGHPFRSRLANDALGSLPLSPRIPYLAYRQYHLQHHASSPLTDPLEDVESYYLTGDRWNQLSRVGRWATTAHTTLAGRMMLGPPREIVTAWSWQFREIRGGDRTLARWWFAHLLSCLVLAVLVLGVFGMPILTYLGAIYLGHGLSLVRSFCEHRWVPGSASRSAVVRTGPFFSLLFLNNNLHHTHHARPGAPWYRLPALAAELGSDRAAAQGAGLYNGYRDVARLHLFRPVDVLVHPMHSMLGHDDAFVQSAP